MKSRTKEINRKVSFLPFDAYSTADFFLMEESKIMSLGDVVSSLTLASQSGPLTASSLSQGLMQLGVSQFWVATDLESDWL